MQLQPSSDAKAGLPRLIGSELRVAWSGGLGGDVQVIDTLQLINSNGVVVDLDAVDLRLGQHRVALEHPDPDESLAPGDYVLRLKRLVCVCHCRCFLRSRAAVGRSIGFGSVQCCGSGVRCADRRHVCRTCAVSSAWRRMASHVWHV